MTTFYIADNKACEATILQTNKTREDIWLEVETRVDVVHAFESAEKAQEAMDARGMQYVPYDTFAK